MPPIERDPRSRRGDGQGPQKPSGSGRGVGRGRWRTAAIAAAVALAAFLLLVGVLGGGGGRVVAVEVSPGTAERLAAGEEVELLPRRLEVRVGDRLEIINQDAVTHQVGPYTVAAGQRLQQDFVSPGTLQGACTLHPSGEITIVVR